MRASAAARRHCRRCAPAETTHVCAPAIAAICVRNSANTVSYTHLDVYKRQVDIGAEPSSQESATRQKLRKQLRAGELDEREVEFDIAMNIGVDIMTPPGMEDMGQQLRQMFSQVSGSKTHKKACLLYTSRCV